MSITIISPSRWQPYTIADTAAAGPGVHRALRAELERRGVGQPTSSAPIRWAIGSATGHSFGVFGPHEEILGLIRAAAGFALLQSA